MACTQQSAADYLEHARPSLVTHLQNLPLIVENLYQRKVFNEHEVDEAEAENTDFNKARFILDCVRKKGESASYELLRILDISRKRTLDPKLHHWITCFPFREDTETDYSVGTKPCQDYQKLLKNKAKNILKRQLKQRCRFLKSNEVFIPLVLDTDEKLNAAQNKIKIKNRKSKKLRPKKLRCYIPVQKQTLSPEDLLHSHERTILLIGKPGIGKTAVVQKMLSIWCQKDNRTLDYFFYFDESMLSQMSNTMSFESILFDMYCKPREKDRKEIFKDIEENSENVVIAVDGLSNLGENSLIKWIRDCNILPDAKIVITSRSEVDDDFLFPDRREFKVYVQGFSESSIQEFLTKALGSDSNLLNIVLKNQELFSLCHVPMYAFMVSACLSFNNSTPMHPQTVTEMYVHILRYDLMKVGKKTSAEVEKYMNDVRDQLIVLMKGAYEATEQKMVSISNIDWDDMEISQVFLKKITVEDSLTSVKKYYAFLHNTVQEFFSALYLLGNAGEIDTFLQLCLKEQKQHMKHLIPFLFGLLSEQNLKLLKSLYSEDQIKRASDGFWIKVINAFLQRQPNEQTGDEEAVDVLFLCLCLYESQSPEACRLFLEKVNYRLDLSEEDLDPHQCCAVSYVIRQLEEKLIDLSLENCRIPDGGLKMVLKILSFLRDKSLTLCHLWASMLSFETPRDYTILLNACRMEIHLPIFGPVCMFRKAGEIMNQASKKISFHLHCGEGKQELSDDLCNMVFEVFPHMKCLRFEHCNAGFNVIGKLCLKAALSPRNRLQLMFQNHILPILKTEENLCDFLLDLYSHVKHYESQTGRSVLPALKPLYQSAPQVWCINLSERKASIFLEVLKLQQEKKPVELRGCSDEESEVSSFLQCLPYISQLRFFILSKWKEEAIKFLLKLFVTAAECDAATGERFTQLLKSADMTFTHNIFPEDDEEYKYVAQCDFLLDLYSHVKHYESETGRSVLPALQPLYQSVPKVWCINLSERKASIFLEVLKLQQVKKPVELRGCSDEESEVSSFLQCLPYISQLRFFILSKWKEEAIKFLLKLFVTAAECGAATGERFTQLLISVCYNDSFLWYDHDSQCDFLLDLYSHVKHYESETGRSVLPALQPLYQSVPKVWYINLSKIKASIFLEVLKLQQVKKPVELRGCSDEESEVRSFLQCLPYISQLSFISLREWKEEAIKFLLKLFVTAAECDAATGERFTQLLISVCNYNSFPWYDQDVQCDVLLDLYSHVKHYESETGRSILPALQPLYQSVPKVWCINLSERKASIFLEVLKLQQVKKPVELRGCSDEESEVRSFLQCLPYISQLRFNSQRKWKEEAIKFLLKLFVTAAECDAATGESFTQLLISVCNYDSFPWYDQDVQCDVLLDLYSHVKHYESETGRSVLPALQPLYQSVPEVWCINLSERKASIFLEVLKLQQVKKPVELRGCSDEESEVRSFLQCLPYISQLRFDSLSQWKEEAIKFLLKLFVTAAECDAATGERFTQLLISVCNCDSFPCYNQNVQCDFLLDLYSHVKHYESETGRSVLPALKPLYQSAPKVWCINLSERKASIFLEVLKFQQVKKPVELNGCSDEESEVRSFLQCLPYISQLRFFSLSQWKEEAIKFLLKLFVTAAECDAATGERFTQLLISVYNYNSFPLDDPVVQCDFLLDLYSHVKHYESETGRSVLPALKPLYQSVPEVWCINLSARKASIFLEVLKLQQVKKPVELRGCSDEESEVRSFLQCLPYISQLRLCKENLLQLSALVYEAQEDEFTHSFLQKVGEDLSSCVLKWKVIYYFLQYCPLTVDFRTSNISQKNIREILSVLDRVRFRRLSSTVMLVIIREIYETRSAHYVPSLMRSAGNLINLNSRELDSAHSAALRFTLQHCTAVSLNLLWTFIPEGELESIFPLLLNHVAHLSVDRLLLLRLLHCCSIPGVQHGAAALLLATLQRRLDFSCRSALDLTSDTRLYVLSTDDCRVISTVIQRADAHTQLNLHDCEIEEAGVEQLCTILQNITLSCSKSLLFKFLACVRVGTELECCKRARNLSQALGGEVDLSHTQLELHTCTSLALFLEHCEGLSELDLSHCQLTDHCLELLLPHLHKSSVLDLSNNDITDNGAAEIYHLVFSNYNVHTVRLFGNRITNKQLFALNHRFEIW